MKIEGNLIAETLTPSVRWVFCEILSRVRRWFLL